MGKGIDKKGELEKLIDYCSSFTKRILCAFSLDSLSHKSKNIWKEQIWIDMDGAVSDFYWNLKALKPDHSILEELDRLKETFYREIILKNKSLPLDPVKKKAISSNYKTLECHIDKLHAYIQQDIADHSIQEKGKFPDVKVHQNELALFIRLAQKYGLISYNGPSATITSRCFSFLTGFSESSLRNGISGKPDNNQILLSLNIDNINNLKGVLDKIRANLNNLEENLDSL